jgi:septal ring factor EnvC (AmiA/AmiB activator)
MTNPVEVVTDYKALAFWFDLIQVVIMAVIGLYAWLSNRHKANSSSIENMRSELSKELNGIDDRLISVEKDVQHMPTHEDMATIHSRVNETAQRLTSMEGELKQINNTMQLMHKHLLNGANK